MNEKERVERYVSMQRRQYDAHDPIYSVGNYQWHENFPYEINFLNKNGDSNTPLFNDTSNKVALDFACGPGRMIKRMMKVFGRVDGTDISIIMLNYAKNVFKLENNLYLSSGYDIGDASKNKYDFIYSSIALQHIASRTIRNMIFSEFSKVLNKDGYVSIQMAYTEDSSFIGCHAHYMEDKYDATVTNSGCDVIINDQTLPMLINDLGIYFNDVSYHLVRVNDGKYDKLNACYPQYWATHWIFLIGKSKQ